MLGYARTLAETEKQASGIANSSVSTASPPEVNAVTQSGSLPNARRKGQSQQPADVTTKNVSDADFLGLTKANLALPKVNSATIARNTITSPVYAGRLDENNQTMRSVMSNKITLILKAMTVMNMYAYTLQNTAVKNNFHQTLKVENTEIHFQIDTGSTANIID